MQIISDQSLSIKQIIPLPLRSFYHRINWFIRNYNRIDKKSRLLSRHFHGPISFDADGMTISQNSDFISEERFARAYQAAAATNPWRGFSSQWRVYIICWMADMVRHLPGDFVECGVNTGAYAKAIIEYTGFNRLGKTFYLFDTFDGLVLSQVSQEEWKAGIDRYADKYKNTYEAVCETFRNDQVRIIRGAVPDTLPECRSDKVAFLSIDMNCVEPEIAAIRYFYDKVVPGGVIVLDDYGFYKHVFQKKAFDAFAREKGIQILSLPTGQGIIFKQS